MMTAKEILVASRELLAKAECWTKGCAARGIGNTPQKVMSDEATCFCMMGAMRRVLGYALPSYQYPAMESARKILHSVLPAMPRDLNFQPVDSVVSHIAYYNDHPATTHQDILDRFDEAIARAAA